MDEAQQPRAVSSGRATLAERLRKGREAKGVSPEVASEQSSVPVRYVRMFEEGEYPVVADPAYLAHFVRRYAGYLGLDAEAASRDLIAETEPETAQRRAGKITRAKSESGAPPATRSKPREAAAGKSGVPDGQKFPTLRGASSKRRVGIDGLPIFIAVAVAATGLLALHFWGGSTPAPEAVVEAPTPAAPQSAPTAPESVPTAVITQAPAPTAMPTGAVEPASAAAVPTVAAPAATPVTPRPAATPVVSTFAKPPVTPSHASASWSMSPPQPPTGTPAPRRTRRPTIDEEASAALRAEQLQRLKQHPPDAPAASSPPQP